MQWEEMTAAETVAVVAVAAAAVEVYVAEAGGGGGGGHDRPGAEGAVQMNPHHRPNLALLHGENTQDVLRTFALPTLGGSTWCKRWHHGGRCFENCPRGGIHVAPPVSVCTLVADALTNAYDTHVAIH